MPSSHMQLWTLLSSLKVMQFGFGTPEFTKIPSHQTSTMQQDHGQLAA